MTPDQINSIRKSFRLIEGKEEVVTLLFYNRLFVSHPDMREMFPGDIKQQAKKLADALKLIYLSFEQLDSLRPILRDLGFRHLRERGVLENHYLAFCQTLIDTFQETAGTHFDDAAKQAWTSLLVQVSSEMNHGAPGNQPADERCSKLARITPNEGLRGDRSPHRRSGAPFNPSFGLSGIQEPSRTPSCRRPLCVTPAS